MQSLEIIIRDGQVQSVKTHEQRPSTTTGNGVQFLHELAPDVAAALAAFLRRQMADQEQERTMGR